jgi:AcrR family transcriptional regulator
VPGGRPRQFTDPDVFAAVGTLLAERGPAGVTLAAVAERLGVTAPAVGARFGSKHGVLVAFADAQVATLAATVAAARRRRTGAVDALVAVLEAVARPLADRRALAGAVGLLRLDLADPVLRRHAIAYARALRSHVGALVDDAVVAGELRVDAPDVLADLVVTTYHGAVLTWALEGSGPLRRWLAARLVAVLAPYRCSGEA